MNKRGRFDPKVFLLNSRLFANEQVEESNKQVQAVGF
jgi:hypothetical protein